MIDLEAEFRSLLAVESVDALDSGAALNHLARLIDLSLEFGHVDGANRAIQIGEQASKRSLAPADAILLDYFLSNAWANKRQLEERSERDRWKWEQPEVEKQIIHLRRAIRRDGFSDLAPLRQWQILTNLGNILNTVGRFVEALEYWDQALLLAPTFGMAQGNRAYGLVHYSKSLYDDGHQPIFLRHAHVGFRSALATVENDPQGVDPWARDTFGKETAWIESVVRPEYLSQGTDMDEFPLGDSEEEIEYRRWCLRNRLFLNPLNDLGPYSVAAHDVLTTPSIVVKKGEGMHFQGFYNQLKQEFVSARYLHYEGVTSSAPHFSDKDVLLYNTLDYPAYSLAVERVKMAFRLAYSILDKVSYFLNAYLALAIPERQVSFRSFWYSRQDRKRGLRPEFDACENWPLRGLFWLSKDLFENTPDFRECLEPDAQELDVIRNHAEHKYLKLHDGMWSGPDDKVQALGGRLDTLAFSVYRSHFADKAMRLLKMTRASLVYLSLAVHAEERNRKRTRPKEGLVLPMSLDTYDDDWKR